MALNTDPPWMRAWYDQWTGMNLPQQQTVHFGGWACPSCRRCYSPAVTECPHCQPPSAEYANGGIIASPAPGSDLIPARLDRTHYVPCPKPLEGGMCGCDDEDDSPRDCLRARCDC